MRNSSTRSFSAVSQNGSLERRRKEKQRKIITAAIAVVTLLIAVFSFLILGEIFGWFDKTEPDPNKDGGTAITYEEKLISSSDIHKGDLLLINSAFPYVFPEKAPTTLSLYPIAGAYKLPGSATAAKLEAETFHAFVNMTLAFSEATGESNLYIYNDDGYRSADEQEALYAENAEYSNVLYTNVGETEHHLGTAIDLYIFDSQRFFLDDDSYKEAYSWIYENAHKYGFINRYPNGNPDINTDKDLLQHKNNYNIYKEFYQFRYVGVAHATYMYQNNLSLEEYLDLLCDSYLYEGEHLKFKGADGKSYEVYYVNASTDSVTTVNVPKADDPSVESYEISGDNKTGFIVTVTLKDKE